MVLSLHRLQQYSAYSCRHHSSPCGSQPTCTMVFLSLPFLSSQRANISSNFGVSAYGRRNSKSRHCAYIRTILIVVQIFWRTYADTPNLVIVRIYTYIPNSSADSLCVRTCKLQILSLCAYPHNPNSRADFFCM